MYKITKRDFTLLDFLQLKKYSPQKKDRSTGKTLNLALLFNCSGATVGRQLKNAGFTEEDCDDALDTLNLNEVYNQALINDTRNDSVGLKYTIIGTKMKDLYFAAYPGLLKRVEREQNFAQKHGYVRSWAGPVRHFPEFKLFKKNSQGNLIGVDKKLFSKLNANLKNKASNTSIQTAEVTQAMPDVTTIHNNLKEWNFKSRIWNYVHDSICLYVYKPEKEIVYSLIKKVAEIKREPSFGIPIQIDVEESDPELGEYYAAGRELSLKEYNLERALNKWNNENGTNLVFTNYIPK